MILANPASRRERQASSGLTARDRAQGMVIALREHIMPERPSPNWLVTAP